MPRPNNLRRINRMVELLNIYDELRRGDRMSVMEIKSRLGLANTQDVRAVYADIERRMKTPLPPLPNRELAPAPSCSTPITAEYIAPWTLTRAEYLLFEALRRAGMRGLTAAELMVQGLGYPDAGVNPAGGIRAHIANMRKKGCVIQNYRGLSAYRLVGVDQARMAAFAAVRA